MKRRRPPVFVLSMIFPGKRYPLFGIMLKRARYKELWLFAQSRFTSQDRGLERQEISLSSPAHHFPVFGIEIHGSFGGNGEPFWRSSIECLSGERTKAMLPSRGGRLIVTPAFISLSQSA